MNNNRPKSGMPSSVKSHEENRINPAYTNLSDTQRIKPFKPQEGVTYIWGYTENGDVIVGIEEPWKYPQAFEPSNYLSEELEALKKLSQEVGFGHPTVTADFTKEAEVKIGKARIAGELFYDKKNKSWCINNKSGRFHLVQDDAKIIKQLMNEVADKIKKEAEINVHIKILKQAFFNPSQMWQKAKNHSRDRWRTENNLNIVIEGLRIIVKHSFKKNISPEIEKQLSPIKKDINNIIDKINQTNTPNQPEQIDIIRDVLQRFDKIVKELSPLTNTDRDVIAALEKQLDYFRQQIVTEIKQTTLDNR